MPAAYASLSACFDAHDRLGELAADVDVARLGADRVRADRAALDEGVRRPAHDFAILERARLGFVGVAAEVVRLAVARLHERPLHARREAGAAAAAQPRFLDDVDDVARRHAERLLQRLVAAALLPAVERDRLAISEVLGEHDRFALVWLVRISHALFESAEESPALLRRHGLDEVFVDHDRRREAARAEAFDFDHGELAVGRGLRRAPAAVCLRNASTTASAPQTLHGDVVQTWMKYLPTGCWWYIV